MRREEIAGVLCISSHTVKDRIDGIRARLGARTTPQAVAVCIARGYLCVDGRAEQLFIPEPFELDVELALIPAAA